MRDDVQTKIEEFLFTNRLKSKTHLILVMAGIIVAAALAYMLLRPGLTAECEHTEHLHTDECYEISLICELAETEPPLAGAENEPEAQAHVHDDNCYIEKGIYELVEIAQAGAEGTFAVIETEDGEYEEVYTAPEPAEPVYEEILIGTELELLCGLPADETAPASESAFPETPHIHSGECYEKILFCELEEHLHSTYCGAVPRAALSALTFGSALEPWDLYHFASSAEVIGPGEENSGSFYEGTAYTFRLIFSERLDAGFEYNGQGVLTYQLPHQLVVAIPVSGAEIRASNGRTIGWYSISQDGFVEVWFADVDRDGHDIKDAGGMPVNFIDHYHDASFELVIYAMLVTDATSGNLNFGSDIDLPYILFPPGIRVQKAVSKGYDITTESIEYTVQVTVVGGSVSDITLDDIIELEFNGYKIKPGDNAVTNITCSEPYEIIPGDGTSMSLRILSTLNARETATITYTLDLSELFDAFELDPNENFSRLRYDFYTNNTVIAKGSDVDPAAANARTRVQTVLLKKESHPEYYYVDDGIINLIQYYLWVGDGSVRLNDAVITDIMEADLNFYDAVTNLAQGIKGGVMVSYYGELVGGNFTYLRTVNLPTPENNTFTIPIPGDLGDVYRVDIAFVAEAPAAGEYSNTVELAIEGGTYDQTEITRVDPVFLEKKAVSGEDGFEYSITFFVPSRWYDENIYLLDYAWFRGPVWPWDDRESFFNNKPVDLRISMYPPPEPEEPEFIYTLATWDNSDHFEIYFGGTNIQSSRNSKWQYRTDKTLTITYTMPYDTSLFTTRPDERTILDYIRDNPSFGFLNQMAMIYFHPVHYPYGVWPVERFVVSYIELPPQHINKTAAVVPDTGGTEFDYVVNLSNQPFFKAEGEALFQDSFDPRLEYVPGSFEVRWYLEPTKSLRARFSARSGFSDGRDDPSILMVDHENGQIKTDFSKLNMVESQWFKTIWSAPPFTEFDYDGWGFEARGIQTMGVPELPLWRNWWAEARDIEIRYRLRVKNPNEYGIHELENTASIIPNVPGERPLHASASVMYVKNPVSKNITFNPLGSNIGDVDIIMNPEGAMLTQQGGSGNEPAPERFTAVDTMSGNLSFFLSTIQLFKKDWNGETGEWGEWQEQAISTVPDSLWSINPVDAQTVEFILPNGTPVRLIYKALVTVPTGQTASYANRISVLGFSDVFQDNSYAVLNTQSGVGGQRREITLYKIDEEDHSVRLAGAEFDLYVDAEYSGYNPNAFYELEGKKFYHIQTVQTDASGMALLNSPILTPTFEMTFLLVESKPPSGYMLPQEREHLFVIRSMTENKMAELKVSLGNRDITLMTDYIHITNEPYAGGVMLPGTGGGGRTGFIIGGLGLMTVALLIALARKMFVKNTVLTKTKGISANG